MTVPTDPHRDLAGVLHDVSNALTVLLGWVNEARVKGASAEAVDYALTVVEQRARIARDLARHAIGSPRIDEQRSLDAIVDETCSALVVEAQRLNVQLVVRRADVPAQVAGAIDLGQVLTNVVLNALAYAPSGTPVEVVVLVEDERCLLVVTDAGPGVPATAQERIFEGQSHRQGGTGVGLRHSRALARAWAGDVELLTHDGTGARFCVTWPRIDAVPRPPVSTSRVSVLAGMRVLVVEDDIAVTQLLEISLEAHGAEVIVATTFAQFRQRLAEGHFDAALVDLSPIAFDVSGALASFRAVSPGATIILVTGNADAYPEAIDEPNFEVVRKPFEVRELVAILGRLARNR